MWRRPSCTARQCELSPRRPRGPDSDVNFGHSWCSGLAEQSSVVQCGYNSAKLEGTSCVAYLPQHVEMFPRQSADSYPTHIFNFTIYRASSAYAHGSCAQPSFLSLSAAPHGHFATSNTRFASAAGRHPLTFSNRAPSHAFLALLNSTMGPFLALVKVSTSWNSSSRWRPHSRSLRPSPGSTTPGARLMS